MKGEICILYLVRLAGYMTRQQYLFSTRVQSFLYEELFYPPNFVANLQCRQRCRRRFDSQYLTIKTCVKLLRHRTHKINTEGLWKQN